MKEIRLPRIDKDSELKGLLEKYSRFRPGDVWEDEKKGHKIACLDVSDEGAVEKLFEEEKASLSIQDPPYNLVAFDVRKLEDFIEWSQKWVELNYKILKDDASLYIWLGADQKNHFVPFADFVIMMRKTPFASRSFITMRNQRGYGTQKNWMAVRQELLYYVKGNPPFNVEAVYTRIPKSVKGYYKEINGVLKENLERSKSEYIRAGNVWIDIQQVFYLREENVSGCFAQKPLQAIERIIKVSSREGDLITDFFSHSGTTLIAAERNERKCVTIDIEPVFCDITMRRLEHLRSSGKTGWQTSNPFAKEIRSDKEIKKLLRLKYKIEV